MKSILGIGNALTDILAVLPDDSLLAEFHLPKGSMQHVDVATGDGIWQALKPLGVKYVAGGSAANTITCTAILGMPSSFIGKVGNDELGQLFRSDQEQYGIRTQLLTSEAHSSGRSMVFVSGGNAERTFAVYLGAALDLVPEDLRPEWFEGYDYFHIEGYLVQNQDLVRRAVELARAAGCIISLDLASYNVVNENHAFLKGLVKQYVDIVFANEDESFAYTHLNPEEAVQMIAEQCDIAVVKVGKNGSYIQQGSKRHHIGAITTNCADSTGAGDLFAGGFLHALSDGFDIRRCAEIGTIAAGRVVEIVGTKLSEETWDEIRRICALYRGFMQKYTND